jgi:photosystem II stability/assembly factor-like uncharacterized protein
VGGGGTLIATTDGGARWQPQASGTQAPLLQHHLHRRRPARLGGGRGRHPHRHHRRRRQLAAAGERHAGVAHSITFTADGQRGWAVGLDGTVIATTDGGARWQPQASGTQAWLTSITFTADGQRGWAVGEDGTLIATTDGGARWQPQASGTQEWL